MTTAGRGWLSNGLAGLRIVGHLVTGPLLRRRRMSWGATDSEVEASWPGGELIPHPAWTATHAVTVAAPAEQGWPWGWPWVAQLGQGRGGFYSFERLENLLGCQIRNVDRVLPEHQDVAAAGEIRLAPQMAMRVARAQRAADLVLVVDSRPEGDSGPDESAARVAGIWSLHLRPAPGGGTRLVERLSYPRPQSIPERIFSSRHLIEPISYVMSKEMLSNIRDLAERREITSASDEDLAQPALL